MIKASFVFSSLLIILTTFINLDGEGRMGMDYEGPLQTEFLDPLLKIRYSFCTAPLSDKCCFFCRIIFLRFVVFISISILFARFVNSRTETAKHLWIFLTSMLTALLRKMSAIVRGSWFIYKLFVAFATVRLLAVQSAICAEFCTNLNFQNSNKSGFYFLLMHILVNKF